MPETSVPDQKNRLRKLLYKRRAAAAKVQSAGAGPELAARAVAHLGATAVNATISVFLPIRTEIDTRPLIDALIEQGARVVLPTIVGESPDLVFKVWAPGDPLIKGAFDVEEPGPHAEVQDPSILVVPLLAFDRAGYRLGYGGGYYDRAIERLSAIHPVRTLGIAYDAQEVVHVPREAHDARLDAIVTPRRTLEFESR